MDIPLWKGDNDPFATKGLVDAETQSCMIKLRKLCFNMNCLNIMANAKKWNRILKTAIGLCLTPPLLSGQAGGSEPEPGMNLVPVGTYLYAQEEALRNHAGRLIVEFADPGPHRLVVAYGRRHRKDRHPRSDTTEAERELFKPIRARLLDGGRRAVFEHLPPDFYDLAVIDDRQGTVFEGLQLLQPFEPEGDLAADRESVEFREAADSLGLRNDRIGGWEAFFDHKNFIRLATDGRRGAMLVQQMRLGRTYAESGDLLRGTVHSLDVVWLERAAGEAGWQVLARQQLYRNEIGLRRFFEHRHVKALRGIRVGVREIRLGPVELQPE